MIDEMPDELRMEIAEHIRSGCAEGEKGWSSAKADEDALTGDLGASIRINGEREFVYEEGEWRWRIRYNKFRGRGPGAEEKVIGADGIVQLEIEDLTTGKIETKGLLFQAKKHDANDKTALHSQVEKMEKLVPNGSAVFQYGPRQYEAFSGSELIAHDHASTEHSAGNDHRLGDYLADKFLQCKVGGIGLYYEASKHTLFVPRATAGYERYRASLKHRFGIEVKKL